MAVENAPGYPAYSGTFIPEIWSTNLLIKFYPATVLYDIANTDYEGEIKNHGDKVIIRKTPDVTIKDYTKGAAITPETLESDNVELFVDKGKYFYFKIDDVDKYQSDLDLMSDWAEDASQQMAITIDTEVLGTIYGQVDSSNQGSSAGVKTNNFNLGTQAAPLNLTKSNILDYIVDCATVLEEQNIPLSNRFMVIPPWVAGMIQKSELKDASVSGDGVSLLRNGHLGEIANFMLYSSNLLAVTSGVTNIIFGHKSALTFASQITEMDYFDKLENTFGKAIRGLNVYGFKVLKPEALGTIAAIKG